jgi:replicative DNA helicase
MSVLNVYDYGKLIYDLFLRRELIAIGEDMVNEAFDPKIETPAAQQIEANEEKLFNLATSGSAETGFITFETALTNTLRMSEAAHKREGKIAGVATDFRDVDRLLGGLHDSDLVILAGRPSMGKTALATNIGFNVAKNFKQDRDDFGNMKTVDGGVVAFFSLEMSAEQLANRILAEEAKISSERIRRGDINRDEFTRLVQAAKDLARVPFYIDDTPALSISAIRTRARRLARKTGLNLIMVDYLQLLTTNTGSENRVQELSEITRGLKAIAKELNIPVVALSQLSRQVEQRDDKRPQLSDLRESGSIEQDADVVMFVFREQYYVEREEPIQKTTEDDEEFNKRYARWSERIQKVANLAEVIVAKQRHGPIGKVKLVFDGATTRFSSHTEQDYDDYGD